MTIQKIKKTEFLPYSPAKLYSLVADIERYPEFLPGCMEARVLDEKDGEVTAELGIGYGPLEVSFVTRNRNTPGEKIEMRLVRGPFKSLEGTWSFEPRGRDETRVRLKLVIEFAEGHIWDLFRRFGQDAANSVMHAFTERARSLYSSGDG